MWFTLLIKAIEKSDKFDYIYTIFFGERSTSK
jgi:hypothetical protein